MRISSEGFWGRVGACLQLDPLPGHHSTHGLAIRSHKASVCVTCLSWSGCVTVLAKIAQMRYSARRCQNCTAAHC